MREWLMILMLTLSMACQAEDTLRVEEPERKLGWLRRTIRSFSKIDTNYVEPQHYNWALMLQSINTYDYYRLSTTGPQGQSISFAPSIGVRMGPFFGWRWVFLGYTVDLRNMNFFRGKRKLQLEGSIYSAQIGADLYYRRSVDDYKIRRVDFGKDIDTSPLEGQAFDGLNVSITGVNLYYIFNHKRFSYPAAFAQSTCQKISCGSWMAGVGYMNSSIDFDYERLEQMAHQSLGQQVAVDSGLMFNNLRYYNINISGGYAYNWVFARNWLFCSSLQVALAYKESHGETAGDDGHGNSSSYRSQGFDFRNINLDGIGRFGLVWNNTKYYAGASAIVRAYNYRKSRFAANNIFGELNLYMGLNFGARGKYKKRKL
jgi:hypothetical protein